MKLLKIKILGISYPIRIEGAEEERYTKKLAQYVDSKIRRLVPSDSRILSTNIAVKAALNIADELHRLKREVELSSERTRKRKKKLIKLLEVVREYVESGK